MINWKIFKAGRGEGKTRWLLNRALEAHKDGYELCYVGSKKTMFNLVEMWMAETHTLCPIQTAEHNWKHGSSCKMCFFTDGLIENARSVGDWQNIAQGYSITWYATMNKEDFVN